MRCQDCKTCLSAIKKGHIACMKTFNYKKSKVIEAAATHQQRNIYNFLKTFGCPRSLDVEIELCAKNQWLDEMVGCSAVLLNITAKKNVQMIFQGNAHLDKCFKMPSQKLFTSVQSYLQADTNSRCHAIWLGMIRFLCRKPDSKP